VSALVTHCVRFLVPSMESVSFLRELVAYYTLLESSSAVSLAAASEPPKDSYISLLSLDNHNDRASSVTGASGYCIPIDSHSFTNGLGTPCTLYGTMVITFLFIICLAKTQFSIIVVILQDVLFNILVQSLLLKVVVRNGSKYCVRKCMPLIHFN